MRIRRLHRWDLAPREAVRVQEGLRGRVREAPLPLDRVRVVAGCDVAGRGGRGIAAVVAYDIQRREILELVDYEGIMSFPYVPGLLSFREVPLLLEAFARLRLRPDAVLCDGQGRAHPRRLGLACHLGLCLDLPTVGAAKSRLIGAAREPGLRRGSSTLLRDGRATVGRAVRTRDGVRPLYVSVGHRTTLADAVALVLASCRGYRLPEPARLADLHVRARARAARAGGTAPMR